MRGKQRRVEEKTDEESIGELNLDVGGRTGEEVATAAARDTLDAAHAGDVAAARRRVTTGRED